MSDLSQDQVEKRAAIQKSATIWGGIVGVLAGLIALWLLGGQGAAIRYGGAVAVAVIAGYLVFSASFKSGSKSAQCEKCGAAFSRSRSDHVETLASSENKEKREEQEDKSTKVTTWIEDSLDVVDTYTCAKCGDNTTKAYKTTRKRDEKTTSIPYEAPKKSERAEAADAAEGRKASRGKGGSRKG